MKYKRQLMTSVFALSMLTSGTLAFAADIPTIGSKMIQQTNQVKMKSHSFDVITDAKGKDGKDYETKDDIVKKVVKAKHKKSTKTHKVKPITSVVKSTL